MPDSLSSWSCTNRWPRKIVRPFSGNAGQGEITAQAGEQGFADLADITGGGGVESRAVLEEDLLAAALAQPLQSRQRFDDSVFYRRGAGLEGDDDSVGIQTFSHLRAGNADALHGAHAAAHQHVGQVCGAGEIVGDAAQQRAWGGKTHDAFLRPDRVWRLAARCQGKS
jgi:hypothetical protein